MDAGAPAGLQDVAAGRGEVACELVAGASAVVRVAARNPLKIVVVRERGEVARVHLATFGGGLLAGDHVRVGVECGAGSALVVGASAPGKVYKAEGARVSEWSMSARAADRSLLAIVPPPVACFADARYRQRIDVALEDGASFVGVDAFTSGRAARGERWAFERVESRLKVTSGSRAVVHEALRLEAGANPIARRFGRVEAFATVVLVGPRTAALRDGILQQYQGLTAGRSESLVVAASPVGDGLVVRVAGDEVEQVTATVDAMIAPLVRASWHGPW